jgi:uncharacterized protein (DUF302 family)
MGISILYFVFGMILMGVCIWLIMPKMMMTTHKSENNFEQTLMKLRDQINVTGDWKVTKEFDFQKNIQDAGLEKIEKVGSVAICNPKYASLILSEEPNRKVTSIMPLTIGVYENKDNDVFISELNIRLMGMMFGGTIAKVMSIAGRDVKNIIISATRNK